MSKLFSKGEIEIIRLITDGGIFEYKSLMKALNSTLQNVKNRLSGLGKKIQYNGGDVSTGITWGIADLLFLCLQWQREAYIGDGICKVCYQTLNDDSAQRVDHNDLCFAHHLESDVLERYATIERKEVKKAN